MGGRVLRDRFARLARREGCGGLARVKFLAVV